MPDDVLSRLQQLLATAGAAGPAASQARQLQQEMGRDTEQAPPGFWDAIMQPPTDLPLEAARPMSLAGGDRVFRPGGTIGTQLGLNEAGIYGRSVPMGNQDTVVPVGESRGAAIPTAQAGIDPNAWPMIWRRVLAANPQLAGALNQLMARP